MKNDISWHLNTILALLQFPAFFLYFPTIATLSTLYQLGLSALICLCSLYKATGALGPLFVVTVYLNDYLFTYYVKTQSRLLMTAVYWSLMKMVYPHQASIDRLVLFLLACLGSKLCTPAVHDHCVVLALTTMTFSLTDSLSSFRQWFGETIEVALPYAGRHQRRMLAKLRVLLIGLLAAILLKTSITPETDNHSWKLLKSLNSATSQRVTPNYAYGNDSKFTIRNEWHLTAREFTALVVTLSIAIHMVAREFGIRLPFTSATQLQTADFESLDYVTPRAERIHSVSSSPYAAQRTRISSMAAESYTRSRMNSLAPPAEGPNRTRLQSLTPPYTCRLRAGSLAPPYSTRCRLNSFAGFNTPGDVFMAVAARKKSFDDTMINESEEMMGIEDVINGSLSLRQLEHTLQSVIDRVNVRREYIKRIIGDDNYRAFDVFDGSLHEEIEEFYQAADGKCCENTVGFVQIPLGFAGPLLVNKKRYLVPMATTEGALIASTARGCKLLSIEGVDAHVIMDKMTRGPVFKTSCLSESLLFKNFIDEHRCEIKQVFESTSKYAKLQSVDTTIGPSTRVFVKFAASTGDAMGMNMLSKGTERVVDFLLENQKFVQLVSLSGNFCVDKKQSASNWIQGRGKSVVAECKIPRKKVESMLKVNPEELVQLNVTKNLLGSTMSASQPGAACNAQAANIVAAIFAACGQDLGQVGTSSACLTWFDLSDEYVHMSVTMPCIEVGTVGGGTRLPIQQACLQQLEISGSCEIDPGRNAKVLACVVAATVMAAELSLLAALCSNDLVEAHMKLNR